MKDFSWRQFLHEVEDLKWYDSLIAFIFRFMAKTSEPLLAIGIIISAIDFLQKGQLLAAHPQLAFAWSCAQGIAMEVSVGPVLVSALDANEDGDVWKARLYGALSVLLGVVGGAMLLLQFIASIMGLAETQITPLVLYPLFLFRTVASVGYIALSCTKHKRFSGRLSVKATEVPQLLEMVSQIKKEMEEGEQRSTETMADRHHHMNHLEHQVQASEQRIAEMLTYFQTSVQAMIERQHQDLPKQIEKIVAFRSRATEVPAETTQGPPLSVPLRSVLSSEEFDKGQFVRECLTENPDMKISQIQQKAQDRGQSIATSYISDIRKAFRTESEPQLHVVKQERKQA